MVHEGTAHFECCNETQPVITYLHRRNYIRASRDAELQRLQSCYRISTSVQYARFVVTSSKLTEGGGGKKYIIFWKILTALFNLEEGEFLITFVLKALVPVLTTALINCKHYKLQNKYISTALNKCVNQLSRLTCDQCFRREWYRTPLLPPTLFSIQLPELFLPFPSLQGQRKYKRTECSPANKTQKERKKKEREK
jgi:hypothetical protein